MHVRLSLISGTTRNISFLILSKGLTSFSEATKIRDMKRQRVSPESSEEPNPEEICSVSRSSKLISCLTEFDRAIQLSTVSLRGERLITLPTDTIYGICGLAQSSTAIRRIYEVKERDPDKPIAICVAKTADLYRWAHVNVLEDLLSDLLPGPVTLVFRRRTKLNPELNPGTNLIGIRIPDNSFIRRLATECGEPLALTSANKSGHMSPLKVQEFTELWPYLDLIVDGGPLGDSDGSCPEASRLGSTVVDLSHDGRYRIIRDGSAAKATVNILQKHSLSEVS